MAYASIWRPSFRVHSRRDSSVLLVERDHASAEMYKLGFLLRGLSVDVAADGEEGIQWVLHGHLPDVIVLDLGLPRIDPQMPRKDQLDLLATLRSIRLTESVPIVALSDDTDSFDDALRRGATECIEKLRTTPRQLARKIEEILDRRNDA